MTHLAILGTTGCGKTYFLRRLMEQKFHEGYKIIVLGEADCMECEGLMLPTERKEHLNFFKRYQFTPQGLPVEYFHPISADVPKMVPKNMNLFSLSIKKSLSDPLLLLILSNSQLSDASSIAITHSIESMEDDASFSRLPLTISDSSEEQTVNEVGFGNAKIPFFIDARRSVASTTRVLIRLKDLGIFASENFAYNIDKNINEILLSDKISVFSTKWLVGCDDVVCAINYYLLQLIIKHLDGSRKTLIIVDDAWRMFPAKKKQETKAQDRLVLSATKLIKWCRKKGGFMIALAQKPDDIHESILNEMTTKVCFKMEMCKADARELLPAADEITCELLPKLNKNYFVVVGYKAIRNRYRGFKCNIRETLHVTAVNEQSVLDRIGYRSSDEDKNALVKDWSK